MSDLTIYDSQGVPIGGGVGDTDEEIKDFFFSGVRVALETVGSTYTFVAFFRARDSSASRSEQYYGVLETTDEGDLSNFHGIIEDHMRNEHGMELVTSKDDTAVFESLSSGSFGSAPGDRTTRQDIADLVNDGEQARVGVASYEEATELLRTYLKEIDRPNIAIAENAQSSTLSTYDLVIEKGTHSGLALLGDTEQRIEEMKKRKRRERQQLFGADGEEMYGQSQPSGPFGLPMRMFAAAAAVGLVVLLVAGTYGACFLGVSIPVVGDLPGMSCGAAGDGGGGGTGGPADASLAVDISANMTTIDGERTILVTGNLSENDARVTNSTETLNYTLMEGGDENTTVENQTTVNIDENGTFEFSLNDSINESTYQIAVEWRNTSATATASPPGTPDGGDEQSNDSTTDGQSDDSTDGTETTQLSLDGVSVDPTNANESEEVSVTADVTNAGDQSVEQPVFLLVDGNETTNRTVSVAAGTTQSVELTWQAAFDGAGSKQLTVRLGESGEEEMRTVSNN